jgi:hypothetical protein
MSIPELPESDFTNEQRKKVIELMWKSVVNYEKCLTLIPPDTATSKKVNTLFNSAMNVYKFFRDKKDLKSIAKQVEKLAKSIGTTVTVSTPILLLDKLKSQIKIAELDRCKCAAIRGLILIYGDELKHMSGSEFVQMTELEESYSTVFDGTIAQYDWLTKNGYKLVKVSD